MSPTTLYIVALDDWDEDAETLLEGMLLFDIASDSPEAPRGFWSFQAAEAYATRQNEEGALHQWGGRRWRVCAVRIMSPVD